MKIVIPSYNRAATIKTHKYLDAGGVHDYKIILHTEAERREYLKNNTIRPETLIVSNAPRGISNQRRFITSELISLGEWYLTLDDNIVDFTGVAPKFYNASELPVQTHKEFKSIYDYPYSASELLDLMKKDIRPNVKYIGYATVPNFFFRGVKYRDVGYVISKAALIQRTHLTYDAKVLAMDDYAFTAENLLTFGRVLINNFLMPTAGHYERGGIGTYEERLPSKIADCQYLINKYPGLFRYKVKTGCHPRAELQIRFTSLKQVNAWRGALLGGLK